MPTPSRGKPVAKRDTLTLGLILDLLTNEIHRLKGSTGRGLYEIGARLARILDEELWKARGYQSFEDYLERGVSFSRSTAYKLMRVARRFKPDVAERYGVEKLDLGLRYADAQSATVKNVDPLKLDVRVRDSDGRYRTVRFLDATPADLRRALWLAAQSPSKARRLPERYRLLEELLQRTLPEQTPRKKAFVRLGNDARGRQTVTFQDIPRAALADFAEALVQVLRSKPDQ